MQQKARYPKRPVRAALITFVILSAYMGAFMPFDESVRSVWEFGYCALLAVATIGLIRIGRRLLLLLVVLALVAIAPAVVGVTLIAHFDGSLDSLGAWVNVSTYLIYVLIACGICLVIRGWTLYFTQPYEMEAK